MKRAKVIATLKELPLNFEIEELFERLIFVDKIEKGLSQLDEGKKISHEKVKEIIKKW
jgi:predicted transcriptional regulator